MCNENEGDYAIINLTREEVQIIECALFRIINSSCFMNDTKRKAERIVDKLPRNDLEW